MFRVPVPMLVVQNSIKPRYSMIVNWFESEVNQFTLSNISTLLYRL